MSSESNTNVFKRWADEVRRRVKDHAFAKPTRASARSGLDLLLDRIHKLHFKNDRLAYVDPPLPWFPRLPLDHDRWVELRLRNADGAHPLARRTRARVATPTIAVHRLLQQGDSVLVLGAPGSGKSTLLRWSARYMIQEPRLLSLIPVYIEFRSYARWREKRPDGSLYQYFWESQLQLPGRQSEEFRSFLEYLEGGDESQRSMVRMLLDGWDEVYPEERSHLLLELERFEFGPPAIVASRPLSPPSSLPRWRRYDISPLSFVSMVALMREWFSHVKRPELETSVIAHLDRQLELRELARNPFVLTLICAVAADEGEHLAETRGVLYRQAVRLIAQYYNEQKATPKNVLDEPALARSAEVALKLLLRSVPSPYVFARGDINALAQDKGALHQTWNQARLIGLNNEHEATYAFLHTTLHEFLAAEALAATAAKGPIDLGDLFRDRPGLFSALVFLVGLVEGAALSAVSRWLHGYCSERDRFGLRLVQAARLAAQRPDGGGGSTLVGFDLRPELWRLFIESPVPQFYVDAVVELDTDYAIDQILSLHEKRHDLLARFILLFQRVRADHPRRRAELMHAPGLRVANDALALDLLGQKQLGENVGVTFDGCITLAEAAALPTARETIAAVRKMPDSERSILTLRFLGRSRTDEAEAFLIEEMTRSKQYAHRLVDALGDLGTPGACDVLMRILEADDSDDQLVLATLQALRDVPVHEGAETILELASPKHGAEFRVAAIRVLASCDRSRILNKMADYALPSEPDETVRRETIEALTEARCMALLRHLLVESATPRADVHERRAIWVYLGTIARYILDTRDFAQYLPTIEKIFLSALNNEPQPPEPLLIEQCAACANSVPIQERLRAIVRNGKNPSELRAAAIRALETMNAGLDSDDCLQLLEWNLDKPALREVAEACADVLADRSPELLLPLIDAPIVKNALWRMSVTKNALVYNDRIVRKSAATAPHHRADEKAVPGEDDSSSAGTEALPTTRPGRGRPRKHPQFPAKEAERISNDWKSTRAQYRSKKVFAQARGLSEEYVREILEQHRNRVRKRK